MAARVLAGFLVTAAVLAPRAIGAKNRFGSGEERRNRPTGNARGIGSKSGFIKMPFSACCVRAYQQGGDEIYCGRKRTVKRKRASSVSAMNTAQRFLQELGTVPKPYPRKKTGTAKTAPFPSSAPQQSWRARELTRPAPPTKTPGRASPSGRLSRHAGEGRGSFKSKRNGGARRGGNNLTEGTEDGGLGEQSRGAKALAWGIKRSFGLPAHLSAQPQCSTYARTQPQDRA